MLAIPVALARERVDTPTSNAALVRKYDAVAYAAQSNALSHPDHLAVVATLFGLEPADVATCRVLELGCSDGANLLPMAANLPGASFVGCDLSPRAIAAAQSAVAELGLSNVDLFEGDLAALPETLGDFDYMIAHGVYSWVPAPVRDAMFALAQRRLKRDGILFVSYNVYPGCHVRQAVWESLRFHIEHIEDASERLGAARAFAAALAEPGTTQNPTDALLRQEFRRVAQITDSALYHDDLAEPNDPVYFHEFAAHAARYDLRFVAEAKLSMTAADASPAMQHIFAGRDRCEVEQLLDLAQLRRFRQSLLARGDSESGFAIAPERIAPMRIGASVSLLRSAAEGKPLVEPGQPGAPAGDEANTLQSLFEWMVAIAPETVPVSEIAARLAGPEAAAGTPHSLEAILTDACVRGALRATLCPPALVAVAGDRPRASAFARWQAGRGIAVTNLQHETMQVRDAAALRLLALLDGSRTRSELATAMADALPGWEATRVARRVDEYLAQFGKLALLAK